MAANETGTFDPQQVQMSFGALPIGGDTAFADGTAIKVEWDDPKRFKHKVGITGAVARAKNRNRSVLVSFVLLATASLNDDLTALYENDESTVNGAGVLPFVLKDLGGTTLVQGPDAWIEEVPNIEYSGDVGTREWKIRIARTSKMKIGGSTLPTS